VLILRREGAFRGAEGLLAVQGSTVRLCFEVVPFSISAQKFISFRFVTFEIGQNRDGVRSRLVEAVE
jgi:hypothetical protein